MNCFIKRAFMLIAIAFFTFGFANAQEEKSTGEKIVSGTVSALKSVGKKTSKVKKGAAKGVENLTSDSSNKTVSRIGEEISDRIDREPAKIIGTWTYKEPALDYMGGNILKEAASLALEKKVESKLQGYYSNLGFKDSKFLITFSENKRFSIKLNDKEVGKGRYFRDGTDVFLEFEGHEKLGKLDPVDRENGLDVLMLPSRMRTLMSNIGCSTDELEAIAELLKTLNGVEIGMHMVKVN